MARLHRQIERSISSLMTKPRKCHVIVSRPLRFGRLLRLSPLLPRPYAEVEISRVHQMRGNLAVYCLFEILHGEGFGDVVHGAEHHRFFDALKIVGAGDHDDFCRGTDFARSGEDIKSIEPGAQIAAFACKPATRRYEKRNTCHRRT
jgi:hypothetical protein